MVSFSNGPDGRWNHSDIPRDRFASLSSLLDRTKNHWITGDFIDFCACDLVDRFKETLKQDAKRPPDMDAIKKTLMWIPDAQDFE